MTKGRSMMSGLSCRRPGHISSPEGMRILHENYWNDHYLKTFLPLFSVMPLHDYLDKDKLIQFNNQTIAPAILTITLSQGFSDVRRKYPFSADQEVLPP
jgi:hypothetical protein